MYARLCLLRRFKRPSALSELRLEKVDFFFFFQETPILFSEHKGMNIPIPVNCISLTNK